GHRRRDPRPRAPDPRSSDLRQIVGGLVASHLVQERPTQVAGGASMSSMPKPSAWNALALHYERMSELHLRQLFAREPERGLHMAVEGAGVYLDYSKNRVTQETMSLLLKLAEESGLRSRIDAMFGGEKLNVTERRAVLHVALRASKDTSILVDGKN